MLRLVKKTLSFAFLMGVFCLGAVMAPMEAEARTDISFGVSIGVPPVVIAPPVVYARPLPLQYARPVMDPAWVPSPMPVISTDVQPAPWDGYRPYPPYYRDPYRPQQWNAPRGYQAPAWQR